ncbi:MAG: hypothetical protein ACI4MS_02340 [Candidatus Coproplasma sp.]
MKTKTKGIIASVVATAILGSAVGLGTYSFAKTTKNNFGFKGTYSINALAEETTENKATASTVTVDGVSIDVTSTLTLPSVDKSYTLFVSIIDVDDFDALENVKLGYTVNGKVYNGQKDQLTNVVYSSLTVTTDADTGATSTLYAYELAEKYTSITTAKLVIAEVSSSNVGSSSATLTIQGTAIPTETNTYAYDSGGFSWIADKNVTTTDVQTWTSATTGGATLDIQPGVILEANSKSITVGETKYSYTNRLKLNGAPGTTTKNSVKIELTNRSSITVHGMSGNSSSERSLIVLDSNGKEIATVMTTDGNALYEGFVNLNPGTYYLATSGANDNVGGYNIYGILIGAPVKVTYTEVAEVPATCGADGVALHYIGSDGKLYVKTKGEYVETTEAELVIPATGEHTASETWSTNSAGHWHECTVCGTDLDYADHVDENSDSTCDVCGITISDVINLTVDASALTITDGTAYTAGANIYNDALITLTSDASVTYSEVTNTTKPVNPFASNGTDLVGAGFRNTNKANRNADTDKFIFTANKKITLTLYFTFSNDSYNSHRSGTIKYSYGTNSVELALNKETDRRDVMQSITVTLEENQELTFYATNGSDGTSLIWIFGWNATT